MPHSFHHRFIRHKRLYPRKCCCRKAATDCISNGVVHKGSYVDFQARARLERTPSKLQSLAITVYFYWDRSQEILAGGLGVLSPLFCLFRDHVSKTASTPLTTRTATSARVMATYGQVEEGLSNLSIQNDANGSRLVSKAGNEAELTQGLFR